MGDVSMCFQTVLILACKACHQKRSPPNSPNLPSPQLTTLPVTSFTPSSLCQPCHHNQSYFIIKFFTEILYWDTRVTSTTCYQIFLALAGAPLVASEILEPPLKSWNFTIETLVTQPPKDCPIKTIHQIIIVWNSKVLPLATFVAPHYTTELLGRWVIIFNQRSFEACELLVYRICITVHSSCHQHFLLSALGSEMQLHWSSFEAGMTSRYWQNGRRTKVPKSSNVKASSVLLFVKMPKPANKHCNCETVCVVFCSVANI